MPIFPNWTGWKTIKAALFSLVTIDGVFLTAGEFSPAVQHDAHIAALFLGAVGVIVTALSGTATGPTIAREKASS